MNIVDQSCSLINDISDLNYITSNSKEGERYPNTQISQEEEFSNFFYYKPFEKSVPMATISQFQEFVFYLSRKKKMTINLTLKSLMLFIQRGGLCKKHSNLKINVTDATLFSREGISAQFEISREDIYETLTSINVLFSTKYKPLTLRQLLRTGVRTFLEMAKEDQIDGYLWSKYTFFIENKSQRVYANDFWILLYSELPSEIQYFLQTREDFRNKAKFLFLKRPLKYKELPEILKPSKKKF